MVSLNRVELIGNVGATPEIRYSHPDKPIARFSLATTSAWTDAAGTRQEQTTWHHLVAFGTLAKTIESYVTKGRLLYVDGRINVSTYEKGGESRKRFEIVVRELKLFPQFAKSASSEVEQAPSSLPDSDSDLTPEYLAEQLENESKASDFQTGSSMKVSPRKKR
ncbi:MAG: single-stranded DNA-binding protein [Acidobacteriota bacterium]